MFINNTHDAKRTKFLKPDHSCMQGALKSFNMWEMLYRSDINERKSLVVSCSESWLRPTFWWTGFGHLSKKVKLSVGRRLFPWNFLHGPALISGSMKAEEKGHSRGAGSLAPMDLVRDSAFPKGIGCMPSSFLNHWAIYAAGKKIFFLHYFILLLKRYVCLSFCPS